MKLPRKWIDGLQRGPYESRPAAELSASEAVEWFGDRGDGDMCPHMERMASRAAAWFAEHGEDGSHDHMVDLVWGLVRDARGGHPGAIKAAKIIQRAFIAEIARRSDQQNAMAEWRRSLTKAVGKVAAEAEPPGEVDPCEEYKRWAPTTPDGTTGSKLGRVLTRADLAALPKPAPLIEGWLDLRTSAVVVGATGTNKTFALIGWACSSATGTPWLGQEVSKPGRVILVVGEGAYGLNSRIAAWEEAHGLAVPPDSLITLVQPDSINDKGFWRELTALASEEWTPLIALDTFSSLAPEADETKDAAKAIRHMSELSLATEGAVVMSLHTGWGPQDRARGGSQLEANPDGVIVLQKLEPSDPDSPVSIRRKKNKEGRAGETVWVRRVDVGESCVLEECGEPRSAAPSARVPLERRILNLLRDEPYVYNKTEVRAKVGGKAESFAGAWKAVASMLLSRAPSAPGKRAKVWGLNPKPRARLASWSGLSGTGNGNGNDSE